MSVTEYTHQSCNAFLTGPHQQRDGDKSFLNLFRPPTRTSTDSKLMQKRHLHIRTSTCVTSMTGMTCSIQTDMYVYH